MFFIPETVDKSSLSTLFPKYSPQPCLIVFFHAAPFPRGLHRSLPLLSLFAPPASGFSLSLFCFFFATSPFLCLHLSSFLLRLAYFLAVLCHAFFGCCRESFLIFRPRLFLFVLGALCLPPCYPFLPFRFSFASFCFCHILLLPHFAFSSFCFCRFFFRLRLFAFFRISRPRRLRFHSALLYCSYI